MSIFKLLTSPKKSIAAVVDTVLDRVGDKYEFEFEFVKGGFRLKIVDKKPDDCPAKDLS